MPKRKPAPSRPIHGAWIPDDIWAGTPFDTVVVTEDTELAAFLAAEEAAEAGTHRELPPVAPLRRDFRTNRYRGPCLRCLETVPAGAGGLVRVASGAWSAVHLDCPEAA